MPNPVGFRLASGWKSLVSMKARSMPGPLSETVTTVPETPAWSICRTFANVLVAALALFIAYRRGKHGRPFALAGVLTLVAAILYEIIGNMAAWRSFYPSLADWPTTPFAAF